MKKQPPSVIAQNDDPLRACVHCGLCLEECPTYRLTGDENNSPRGRLFLWRAEKENRLEGDWWTKHYTDECVGCLACVSACPANVPYANLLEEVRRSRFAQEPGSVKWPIRFAGKAVKYPRLFDLVCAPGRLLRRLGLMMHPLVFPGSPAMWKSTAMYAEELMSRHRPTGPTVALLTGCLMEALFREINFATVRVLIQNNVRVIVPDGQGCCGALHEHIGMNDCDALFDQNKRSFMRTKVDRVVTNSAGCGLALGKALMPEVVTQDVLGFLAEIGVKSQPNRHSAKRVYVDLPCHLVHGQKATIPTAILDATGYAWEFAPNARDCCGSGGVYNVQKPGNAKAILRSKAAFLDKLPPSVEPILATANHVCMMQWHSAHKIVKRPFSVRHVIQLLDSETF